MDKELADLIEEARELGLIPEDNLSAFLRSVIKEFLFCVKNMPAKRSYIAQVVLHPWHFSEKSLFLDELESLIANGAPIEQVRRKLEDRKLNPRR